MAKRKSKWYCAVLGAILFIVVGIDAQELSDKVGKRRDGYRTFSGFEFEGYIPSTDGLDMRIKAEVSHVIADDMREGYTGNYSIVGHSQGGLRVLAYGSHLKKNYPEEYERLDGVITMSGIDRGLKALDGGFGTVKARLQEDINIVWRGLRAGIGVFDVFGILESTSSRDIHGVTELIVDFLPDNFRCYMKPALQDATPDAVAEIRDMMPRSGFIKEYVSKSVTHTYKVQTETKSGWDWRKKKVWGVTFWYPVWTSWPVYSYYTAYEDVPEFGNELPVGYIVGLDSNTLGMMDDDAEKQVRETVSDLKKAFKKVRDIHFWKNVGLVGIISGGLGYYDDAERARKWMENFDGELNELKGSSESKSYSLNACSER